jgi:hypothetical protein
MVLGPKKMAAGAAPAVAETGPFRGENGGPFLTIGPAGAARAAAGDWPARSDRRLMLSLLARPGDPLTQRLADGGPVYTETDPSCLIAEPWNAASALLFLVLVLAWAVRLRGRYRRYPFLACCLPVLAVGGVGGTIYHAFRAARIFLVMDYLPIYVLGVAATIYLWVRVSPRLWHVLLVLGLSVLLQQLAWLLPAHYAISVSYASLAVLILVPAVAVLVRTRFRDGGWVVLALACFGVGLFFRIADAWRPPLLPMGTHWLWHLFGAATTAALIEYLYRLRNERLFASGRPT